jgi:hypothetical protein
MPLRLGQLRDAETRFAAHVAQFFQSVHPAEKRPIEYVCRAWAKAWGGMLPTVAPVSFLAGSVGNGLGALERELNRHYWRDNYARNRPAILAQKHERYQPRRFKERGQCQWCQKEFLKVYANSRFCSKQCRRRADYHAAKARLAQVGEKSHLNGECSDSVRRVTKRRRRTNVNREVA